MALLSYRMSAGIRLSLKLLIVTVLSAVWINLILSVYWNWIFKVRSRFLDACAIVWFPILISILICRGDAVLRQVPVPLRFLCLAIFSILSGFLLFLVSVW